MVRLTAGPSVTAVSYNLSNDNQRQSWGNMTREGLGLRSYPKSPPWGPPWGPLAVLGAELDEHYNQAALRLPVNTLNLYILVYYEGNICALVESLCFVS
jgi:hypothetical protein